MRLPRDISGRDLARYLETFGYRVSRRAGSHMRLSTNQGGEHHITIPDHDSLRVGTLSGIVTEVARHLDLPREEVIERLFQQR
jgi:predicted RNA binding protein YcfA (HicA-like mRNA interferase family)